MPGQHPVCVLGGLGPCPSGRAPHPCRKSCWPRNSVLTEDFPTGLSWTHSWEHLPGSLQEALLSPHLTSCLCRSGAVGTAVQGAP